MARVSGVVTLPKDLTRGSKSERWSREHKRCVMGLSRMLGSVSNSEDEFWKSPKDYVYLISGMRCGTGGRSELLSCGLGAEWWEDGGTRRKSKCLRLGTTVPRKHEYENKYETGKG